MLETFTMAPPRRFIIPLTAARQVWKTPIGAHQGVAHPLAVAKIELELAKVMMQKAAWLYDNGQDLAAGRVSHRGAPVLAARA